MNLYSRIFITGVLALTGQTCLGQNREAEHTVPDKMARATSLAMLQHIAPSSIRAAGMREMKVEMGSVRWGPLFEKDKIVAFVFLGKDGEQEYLVPIPKQVSLYAWIGDHWTFRQDLGEMNQITINSCRRFPNGIVQGSLQVGRYEADQSSWRYDKKSKLLVETGWGFWGPAYVVGDYVCMLRGKERLAHEMTHWIYPLIGSDAGDLLCALDENDSGRFAVTVKDRKSGELRRWVFDGSELNEPNNGKPSKIPVAIYKGEDGGDCVGTGVLEIGAESGFDSGYCFTLLTGFSSEILNDKWLDELPKESFEHVPVKATGAKEIVEIFQWPKRNPVPSR